MKDPEWMEDPGSNRDEGASGHEGSKYRKSIWPFIESHN